MKKIKYKKIWKRIDNNWFLTHLKWTKTGDIFKVEDNDGLYMMVSDPLIFKDKLPKVRCIKVS